MSLRIFKRRSPEASDQPIEVGIVSWIRELDDALRLAAESGKPVFALFQEVPGCAGCKQFGAEVLSDQAIVDAIEASFVPLLIHNNQPGRDAEVLAQFGEPAWNYQVVRFLDADGSDLIARRDRVWEAGPLAARMVAALEVADNEVPPYLRLLEQEFSDRLRTAHFAQGCFWVGEMELGQIEGVITTEAAFMAGHEITTVHYDPEVVSLTTLTADAKARGVADTVFVDRAGRSELRAAGMHASKIDSSSHRVAPSRDQKRQISGMRSARGLSAAQLTKVNAFARSAPAAAAKYLSPSQQVL